jgi:hypothetical protein
MSPTDHELALQLHNVRRPAEVATTTMASSKSIVLPAIVLVLRLVAVLLLAGSLALIVTDKVDLRSDIFDGGRFTLKFKDIYTYR